MNLRVVWTYKSRSSNRRNFLNSSVEYKDERKVNMFLMFEMYMLNLDCTLEEHIFGAVAKPIFFNEGQAI